MNIRLVCSALIIGALTAVAVPQNLSVAQSTDQKASAPKSATPNTNMTPHKHHAWRHHGGDIRTLAVGGCSLRPAEPCAGSYCRPNATTG